MKFAALTFALSILLAVACTTSTATPADDPTISVPVPSPTPGNPTATLVQMASAPACETAGAQAIEREWGWPDRSTIGTAMSEAVMREIPGLNSQRISEPYRELSGGMSLPDDIPLDEPVTFTIEGFNRYDEAISFKFDNSPGYDFVVVSLTGEAVWVYSDHVDIEPGTSSADLEPGEEFDMSATWDLRGPGGEVIDEDLYMVFGIIYREGQTFEIDGGPVYFGDRPLLKDVLGVTFSLPKEYICIDSIPLVLEVTNTSDSTVSIFTGVDFDNYYAFSSDGSVRTEVWNWWAGKAKILPLYTPWLLPGETARFSRTWELQDSNGAPVAPGVFELQARILAAPVDDLRNKTETVWSNIVEVAVSR